MKHSEHYYKNGSQKILLDTQEEYIIETPSFFHKSQKSLQ